MNRHRRSLYSVHPSVRYARAIIEGLPEKSGKSLEQWVRLLKRSGPATTRDRVAWLREEHSLGMTTANRIVAHAEGRGAEDADPVAYLAAAERHVEKMYAGPREALRPMHDLLVQQALHRRAGLRICPCKTLVPLYREHVIAQIKPSTRTRLDFGLALKGSSRKPPRRLVPTGGLEKGDRITHRIPLTSPADIDDELWKWFDVAYTLDA